jgi:hypothetical protein
MKRVVVVSILCAAALSPSVVSASPKPRLHTHNFTTTEAQVVLSFTGNGPVAGSTAVEVGTASSPRFGNGAVVSSITWTGDRVFTARFQLFYATGSLRGTLHGRGAVNPDMTVSITGAGTITGGTGVYKRASGRFTWVGSTATSGTSPVNSRETGSITY